jgi:hypothetical protein
MAGIVDALAVGSVRVAMPDDQELQGELVDAVVVFGLQPVGLGLAVLGERDQRGHVGGLGGEHQVEQDERVGSQRRSAASRLTAIQAATMSVCTMMNRHDPNTAVTASANRSPRVRCS